MVLTLLEDESGTLHAGGGGTCRLPAAFAAFLHETDGPSAADDLLRRIDAVRAGRSTEEAACAPGYRLLLRPCGALLSVEGPVCYAAEADLSALREAAVLWASFLAEEGIASAATDAAAFLPEPKGL